MTFAKLLAKSQGPKEAWRDQMWLPVHLTDVHRAAVQLLEATGDDQLSALGLEPDEHRGRFHRIVRLAAACHDLGKANDHFQGMIIGQRKLQGLRHEWATLLMLTKPKLHDWLLPVVGDETDWQIVLWAIAGHHPAYNRPSPPRLHVDGAGSEITLLLGHRDFPECLRVLQASFSLGSPPILENDQHKLVGSGNIFAKNIIPWFLQAQRSWSRFDPAARRLVAAVKNCLIASDIAGSALPREFQDEQEREAWIPSALSQKPKPEELDKIIADRLGEKTLRPFQKAVADQSGDVTLVKAGCGSGKTLAAYYWARVRCPGRRLYFCYPTTGTATEGFRDYLLQEVPPDATADPTEKAFRAKFYARLFHGRQNIDLQLLNVREDGQDAADAVARLESFDAWSTPIVTCTVDTVLGIVQNNRRGLYAWPGLAGAAFIFDEIHAYDDRLFGALLRFLQALPGVPVLLMTASLPTARREALEQCLRRLQRSLQEITGPDDLETRQRYRRMPGTNVNPAAVVRDHLGLLQEKAKVLWVSNTVDRVVQAAQTLGDQALIYHSRFRYIDRVKQHQAVISAFQKPGPAVACCSQVAEMSLDLSATLLVTDLAPVPALIQRLGRLNRRAGPEDPVREFLVLDLEPDKHLPYTPEDLAAAQTWLREFGPGDLSQRDLAEAWQRLDAGRRPDHVASAWLDGGPATTVNELREASPGITVIREDDVQDVLDGERRTTEVAIPMPPPPRGLAWQAGECKHIPVARRDSIDYCPKRGAQWRKNP